MLLVSAGPWKRITLTHQKDKEALRETGGVREIKKLWPPSGQRRERPAT